MTTLHKAAQAALEALDLPCDRWNATQYEAVKKARDDLRAALAKEPAQPAVQEPSLGGAVTEADVQKILDNEREKLAQFHAQFGKGTAQPAVQEPAQPEAQEQQPVGYLYDWDSDDGVVTDWFTNDYDEAHSPTNGCHKIRPLYLHPPQPAVQEPAQPDRHAELKSWSLLAARALDDCHRVIETIVAESSTEEEKLNELDKRVYDLFNQALCLHGLMTRTQLDKLTGFGRVEVTGPIDKPAVQKPQPKRLTDEQIDACWRSVDYTQPYAEFRQAVARAIESAVLGEKS